MNRHPYSQYEGLLAWRVIDEAVSALAANQDIKEMTGRSHIVGYLVKRLVDAGATTAEKEGSPGLPDG
jgi:hypothetical protein